ncbi:ABC transporter ATP-binding protein [Pantoea sp. 18069]|uniref:ABC transporter ATP-binding protein n=1 Tax=Pantoea sp. 18069 TaxID=2681415 RepID=UPI00135C396F|nr:ABC transporter ATP-binding protein [Pantoea sp. 18069]
MSAAPTLAQAPLEIQGLQVDYRQRRVLQGLTLPPLAPGRLLALVGPNGAGKSTLLRALTGLLPTRGQVRYGASELLAMPAAQRARIVGFMPQLGASGSTLTVLEATLVAMHGLHAPAAPATAMQALEQLGIAHLAMQPLAHLSGGQRQMAALAQVVVRDCPVVLLDEPVSALDLAHQWQVMQTVQRLAHAGRIVIVVLHDLTLAAQWADDVALLQAGQLCAFGPPQQTITPERLRSAYGVDARVRSCEQGRLFVLVDGPAGPAPQAPQPAQTE